MTIYTLTYWLPILNMGATSAFWRLIWTRTPHPWRPGARRCADGSAPVLETLAAVGVKLLLLRCAGFNNVDLDAAKRCGITVLRVPGYSPEAVAEHAMALAMAANRRICKAYIKVRNNNFALDGLLGHTLYGSASWAPGASARPWPASAAASA